MRDGATVHTLAWCVVECYEDLEIIGPRLPAAAALVIFGFRAEDSGWSDKAHLVAEENAEQANEDHLNLYY